MKKLNLFAYLFIVLTLVPLVSSAPPVTTVQQFETGYTILPAKQEVLVQGRDYTHHWIVYNSSNGIKVTNTTINCSMYMANGSGDVLLSNKADYDNRGFFYLLIKGGNFSANGIYTYGVDCMDTYGGALAGAFEVTETGFNISTAGSLIRVAIILAIVSLMFLFGFIGLKLLDSIYPQIGYTLLGLSTILGIVSLYDIWVFSKSLSNGLFSTVHFAIFNVIVIVFGFIFILVVIFILYNLFKNLIEKKEQKKYGEGYNTKSKQYEY